MSASEPMTLKGYQALKETLRELKLQKPIVAQEIETARAHGDLSENAEYHAAREKQSFLVGRMEQIESSLGRAEIIDPTKLSGEKVVFGATVTLLDLESDEEITYQIVGHDEADIKAKKISIKAPLARLMIGKSLGDEVVMRRPKQGDREYEITKVDFI